VPAADGVTLPAECQRADLEIRVGLKASFRQLARQCGHLGRESKLPRLEYYSAASFNLFRHREFG
jgi:hypothetical protein